LGRAQILYFLRREIKRARNLKSKSVRYGLPTSFDCGDKSRALIQFFCQIENELSLGGKKAITPSIAGQAWITGSHIHSLDPTDPWPLGYKLSDTWPNKL
jgi:hypothetical protein